MFDNVLVGVDGRQGGRDAIALARRLCAPEARIALAHVDGVGLDARPRRRPPSSRGSRTRWPRTLSLSGRRWTGAPWPSPPRWLANVRTVSLEFGRESGDIVRCLAEARPRDVEGGSAPTPWGGDLSDYRTLQGIRMPTRAEVYWGALSPRGSFTGADRSPPCASRSSSIRSDRDCGKPTVGRHFSPPRRRIADDGVRPIWRTTMAVYRVARHGAPRDQGANDAHRSGAEAPAAPKPRLKRRMGLWMVIALVVGNMVGSGIFLLPASLAAAAGPVSIFG